MKAVSSSRPRATPLSLEAMVVDGMGKSGASWGVGGDCWGEGGRGGMPRAKLPGAQLSVELNMVSSYFCTLHHHDMVLYHKCNV